MKTDRKDDRKSQESRQQPQDQRFLDAVSRAWEELVPPEQKGELRDMMEHMYFKSVDLFGAKNNLIRQLIYFSNEDFAKRWSSYTQNSQARVLPEELVDYPIHITEGSRTRFLTETEILSVLLAKSDFVNKEGVFVRNPNVRLSNRMLIAMAADVANIAMYSEFSGLVEEFTTTAINPKSSVDIFHQRKD